MNHTINSKKTAAHANAAVSSFAAALSPTAASYARSIADKSIDDLSQLSRDAQSKFHDTLVGYASATAATKAGGKPAAADADASQSLSSSSAAAAAAISNSSSSSSSNGSVLRASASAPRLPSASASASSSASSSHLAKPTYASSDDLAAALAHMASVKQRVEATAAAYRDDPKLAHELQERVRRIFQTAGVTPLSPGTTRLRYAAAG
jgi:hypothetical protein